MIRQYGWSEKKKQVDQDYLSWGGKRLVSSEEPEATVVVVEKAERAESAYLRATSWQSFGWLFFVFNVVYEVHISSSSSTVPDAGAVCYHSFNLSSLKELVIVRG